MEQTITLSTLIQMGVIVMALWGFYKVVREIIAGITARHDKEQKWDEMTQKLEEERKKICERYDAKLLALDQVIELNHADTESKLQQVRSELLILTDCMAAVLDGLHQQGCNGKVTEAAEKLQQYMRDRAHE